MTAVDTARARWPSIAVGAATVEAFIAEHGIPDVHAGEAALACALGAGDPAALAVFDAELVPEIRGAMHRVARNEDLVGEALQRVRAKLLVRTPEAPPRILEYRGRGTLAAWVQMIGVREVVTLQRVPRGARTLEHELAFIVETDPVLALTKQQYRDAFAAAFQAALDALEVSERTVLRLCFLDGVGTQQLAAMYGVHRATMHRKLSAAREHLLGGIRDQMIARVGVDGAEVDSLIRALATSLDIAWGTAS